MCGKNKFVIYVEKKNKEFAKVITVTFVLLEIKIGPF